HGEEDVQAAMDEASMHEMPYIEKRTGYLAMIANGGMLSGLLGTVLGMIKVFGAVAQVSAADKSTMLSAGISEAMNCTAYGLITAIPTLVAFSLLQGRTQAITDDIQASVASTINMVLRNKDKLNVDGITEARSMGGVSVDTGGKGGKKSLDTELNLVPYIDLLMTIMTFLIMTAVWTQIAMLEVQNAQSGPPDSTPEEKKDP